MQKKLKLAVIALCFAPMAFAQTPVTTEEEQEAGATVVNEQAFTFTEAHRLSHQARTSLPIRQDSNSVPPASAIVLLTKSTMRSTSTALR